MKNVEDCYLLYFPERPLTKFCTSDRSNYYEALQLDFNRDTCNMFVLYHLRTLESS